MQIINMKISEIHPYEKNPRFNDGAVDAVAASIKEFGFKNPIIVDKDKVIIAGHTRMLAAKKLGLEEVPVVVASDLTPEQVQAFRIADNKTGEIAEWNYDLLPLEIKELQEANFDLSLLGFDTEELDRLLNGNADDTVSDGETEPDAVPDVPEETASKRGEVYRLGDHLLMCGDSTNAADTAKLMGEEKADLYLVDPPYNVALTGSNGLTIQNDNMSDGQFREFLNGAFKCASSVLEQGAAFYIGRFYYHLQSESVLYGWKPGAPHHWYSDRCQCTLLRFDKPKCNDVHPSMKTIEMLVYLVKNSSSRGQTVLDNFGGSGSTLIACEQTGRKCRMMELDEKYCDVIRRRWAEFVHGEGCDWQKLTPKVNEEDSDAENE